LEPLEAAEEEWWRQHERTGRPLGSDRFLAKLETLLGRRVRPLPVGRPKKPLERDVKVKGKRK
jgi:putative transposase